MIKILIVEDDPQISRIYHRIFSLEGYTVELAGDGEEGLMKTKSFQPSLILLDITMPKLNGMLVLEALKADEETKKIPVIMLTNLAGDQNKQAALAKGAINYLTKSDYEPAQVVNIVKQTLHDIAAS